MKAEFLCAVYFPPSPLTSQPPPFPDEGSLRSSLRGSRFPARVSDSSAASTPPPPETETVAAAASVDSDEDDEIDDRQQTLATGHPPATADRGGGGGRGGGGRAKDEDEDDEEENMADVEFGKFSASAGDPDKMAKMQVILSQFTEEQMSRYESFRRSGFQKADMKRQLASIIGSQKISIPITIVVSGIAKMFVGELIETGRIVMAEINESGPIRPCHIREAYRRLKLEGKIPKRLAPRLFL